nr:unnamed protein product [Spirometra erinaceieuropaei]
MVSFDVTSLFASIPQDLAIETIELLLQSEYDETKNRLGHAEVLLFLKFCLRTYFRFDGTINEQVKGTPMGSPISGCIAEAALQRLESLVFKHHKPKFWARHVDDTFVVIERNQALTFKKHLNAVLPNIQFTMAILDVLRYEDLFFVDLAAQDDAWKVRLLLRKLGPAEHERYVNFILPKNPREVTFKDTV